MPNYQKMYTTLFNQITDAIEVLQEAQRITEEQCLAADELHVVEHAALRPAFSKDRPGKTIP